MRFRKAYTTHIPVLIKAIQASDGPVMELGSGLFSTPLMHWLCAEKRRKLVTYESVPEYYEFAKQFRSRNHHIRLIDSWDKIDTQTHWSVVLIDHIKERRAIDAIRLKDTVDYIILHDSGGEKVYGYDKVYPHFKHIYHWKFCTPWTTVVSNFKDLSDFNEKPTDIHKPKRAL